jgi:hypothetical protein
MTVPPVRTVSYPRPHSLLCRTLYSASVFLQTLLTTHSMCRILTQLSMGLPRQTLPTTTKRNMHWTVTHSTAIFNGTPQQTTLYD